MVTYMHTCTYRVYQSQKQHAGYTSGFWCETCQRSFSFLDYLLVPFTWLRRLYLFQKSCLVRNNLQTANSLLLVGVGCLHVTESV